jgi:hypothetical protein
MATASYVYALGQVEARFPRPSVEKEMAQATGRADTAGRRDEPVDGLHPLIPMWVCLTREGNYGSARDERSYDR